jgi:Gram-negative bacterial TonB protein C-terminal
MPDLFWRGSCAANRAPQALATPDPLLVWHAALSTIRVSFVIGVDGLVHSPLILEGADGSEDRIVLEALKSWRYRPALCNGVPTEMEGKIAFSIR